MPSPFSSFPHLQNYITGTAGSLEPRRTGCYRLYCTYYLWRYIGFTAYSFCFAWGRRFLNLPFGLLPRRHPQALLANGSWRSTCRCLSSSSPASSSGQLGGHPLHHRLRPGRSAHGRHAADRSSHPAAGQGTGRGQRRHTIIRIIRGHNTNYFSQALMIPVALKSIHAS